MPINLNALLRYKTIDASLRNKQIKCTIDLLIDRCSETLSESIGINTGISERTIRNDIRIMRSDILNYNAPIIFENGYYIYSNNDYSIFGRPIKELDLLKDIQSVLVENFDTINNENIQHLIIELAKITKIKVPKKCAPEGYGIFECRAPESTIKVNIFVEKLENYLRKNWSKQFKREKQSKFLSLFQKKPDNELLTWEHIFKSFEVVEYRIYKTN